MVEIPCFKETVTEPPGRGNKITRTINLLIRSYFLAITKLSSACWFVFLIDLGTEKHWCKVRDMLAPGSPYLVRDTQVLDENYVSKLRRYIERRNHLTHQHKLQPAAMGATNLQKAVHRAKVIVVAAAVKVSKY